MNRDGKQITLDYWRQGIVFMKMLIVSARLIPGMGGGAEPGLASDRTSTAPLDQIIGASSCVAASAAPWLRGHRWAVTSVVWLFMVNSMKNCGPPPHQLALSLIISGCK